jgi:hypothetical protein
VLPLLLLLLLMTTEGALFTHLQTVLPHPMHHSVDGKIVVVASAPIPEQDLPALFTASARHAHNARTQAQATSAFVEVLVRQHKRGPIKTPGPPASTPPPTPRGRQEEGA